MFRKRQEVLNPNPLGAALTVFTVFFVFFSACSLVSAAIHVIEGR